MCWHGCLSGAMCRLAYGPADVTVSCFSKIQIGFTFLVPAHPGSPGERAIKLVSVNNLTMHKTPEKMKKQRRFIISI